MRELLVIVVLLLSITISYSQTDMDLLAVKSRLDAIEYFRADLDLELDVTFINMPPKSAQIEYEKDRPISFSSDDFVMIPKRGLDFSFRELFSYSFMAVPQGFEQYEDGPLKVLLVIPTDKRSDLVMVTLKIDTLNKRIVMSEVNTRKDGTYNLHMKYRTETDVLPESVEVSFQIERIRIPFNFIGKDTTIDRDKMKEEGDKEGKIFLELSNYVIRP